MKFSVFDTLKNFILETLFLFITVIMMVFLPNENIQNYSLTYTRIQLAVLMIRSVQTILIINYTKTRNEMNQKRKIMSFRKLKKILRNKNHQISPLVIKLGCFFCTYCVNLVLITFNPNIDIIKRLYSFVCYTGQKFAELYIIISMDHIQEMISQNSLGFILISRTSSK